MLSSTEGIALVDNLITILLKICPYEESMMKEISVIMKARATSMQAADDNQNYPLTLLWRFPAPC